MLFKKDIKIAFVLPPKCGSASVKDFLIPLGFKVITHSTLPLHHHIKYQDAVLVYPNLTEYTKYGIFRDPLSRFTSAINYIRGPNSKLSYEFFVENFEEINARKQLFFDPQVSWLDHPDINIIKFDNLAEEVISIVESLDGNKIFPHSNRSPENDEPITEMVTQFVREYYAKDYEFAENHELI